MISEKQFSDKPEFNGEWVRLGDVCVIVNGATPRTEVPEYWGGDIKWVTPAELRNEIHTVFDTAKHLTKAGFESASLRMMPAGTILLTTRAPIGKLALAGDEMCCNQGFKCLICPETVNNEWLCRLLKHRVPELQAMGTGATFKELSKRAISDYKICVPPMEAQIDIVKKLTKLDEVLANCRALLSALDNLVKSQFVEMFGDPIANSHDLPLSKWSDVLAIRNGRNQKTVECDGGKFPICGSGGEMGRASSFITKGDSVIIGRKGNINNPILMREPFWNVDTAFGLEPNNKVLTVEYLYNFCKWFDFEKLNKAVTIPSLTKADLLKLDMPLPPLPLQQQFADFVAQVDKLGFDVQQQIEKLETLKQSLMQEYFG